MKKFGLYLLTITILPLYDIIMMPRAIYRNREDLGAYFHNVSLARDQYSNAKAGGNVDESISGEHGVELQKEKYGCCKLRLMFCKTLDFLFDEKDHCINSIDKDEHEG